MVQGIYTAFLAAQGAAFDIVNAPSGQVANYAALNSMYPPSMYPYYYAWVLNDSGKVAGIPIPGMYHKAGWYTSDGTNWVEGTPYSEAATYISVDTSAFTHSTGTQAQQVLKDLDSAIASPGGPTNAIQYKTSAGAFGGSSNFTWDQSNKNLYVDNGASGTIVLGDITGAGTGGNLSINSGALNYTSNAYGDGFFSIGPSGQIYLGDVFGDNNNTSWQLDDTSSTITQYSSLNSFYGNAYFANNVGIGTSSPVIFATGVNLTVKGTASNNTSFVSSISYDGAASLSLYSGVNSTDDPALLFQRALRFGSTTSTGTVGFVERMRITHAGAVGINTTSPIALLDLDASTSSSSLALGIRVVEGSQTPFGFRRSSDNATLFSVGFPGSGAVDLNNTVSSLRLYGLGTGITLRTKTTIGGPDNAATDVPLTIQALSSQSANILNINKIGTGDIITLNASGNLGIGVQAPAQPLSVTAAASTTNPFESLMRPIGVDNTAIQPIARWGYSLSGGVAFGSVAQWDFDRTATGVSAQSGRLSLRMATETGGSISNVVTALTVKENGDVNILNGLTNLNVKGDQCTTLYCASDAAATPLTLQRPFTGGIKFAQNAAFKIDTYDKTTVSAKTNLQLWLSDGNTSGTVTDVQVATFNGNGNVGIGVTVPTSTTHNGGSFARFTRSITAARTLDGTDSIIFASGNLTVTVPTAVGIKDRIYTIKNSGSGTIIVAFTSGQTVFTTAGAVTTMTLSQGQSVDICSDNSNWQSI